MRSIEIPTDTPTEFDWEIQLLTFRGGGMREKQQRKERERDEARKAELHSPQKRQWQKKDQILRGVKMKWTQRVEEKPAHLKHTPGARKDML